MQLGPVTVARCTGPDGPWQWPCSRLSWEPSGEPSAANGGPRRACCTCPVSAKGARSQRILPELCADSSKAGLVSGLSECVRFSVHPLVTWRRLNRDGKNRRRVTAVDPKLTIRSRAVQKKPGFLGTSRSSSQWIWHMPSSDEDHQTRAPRTDSWPHRPGRSSTAAISGPRPTSELTSAGSPDAAAGDVTSAPPPLKACWQASHVV